MEPLLTLREVLREAIREEIMFRFLYVGLRQRVKDQAGKDAFQSLADQEEMHQRVLEDYLGGKLKEGTLSADLVLDHKIIRCLDQPEISPSMDLQEVIHLTANKEMIYHDLYLNLSAIHPNGQVKHLLEQIAIQELEHKDRLEKLFIDIQHQ